MGEPILISRIEAAKLLGVCPNTFDALVKAKAVPGPVRLPIRRKLWHREDLNAALSKGIKQDDREARKAAWARRQDREAATG